MKSLKLIKKSEKYDNRMKCNFISDKPLGKCVTDMTEVKCLDVKLYVSTVFDCFDSAVLGLAIDTNMKATLCKKTLVKNMLRFVNVSYIATPVNYIVKQSVNTASLY